EECDEGAADAGGQRGVLASAFGKRDDNGKQRGDESSAPADQADGADQWAGADLWRERDGQRADWKGDACAEPAQGAAVRGAELRGNSGGLYRERAVRVQAWSFACRDQWAGCAAREARNVRESGWGNAISG